MRTVPLAVVLLGLATSGVAAVEPDEIMPDPAMEARARDISAGLRCLVCQNQSVDDSHAGLARDLRLLVRERLRLGDTDEDVRDFIVARYGEFVLLKPPFDAQTAVLWALPFVLLGGGTAYLLWPRPRAPAEPKQAELSAQEEAELAELRNKNT